MRPAPNPIISVIIPARNEEACLALCLESIVSQRGIEFEVIVVDDASTDRTAEIARSFVASSDLAENRSDCHSERSGMIRSPINPQSRGTRLSEMSNTDVSFNEPGARVIVISAPPLSPNWTGKNNAMSAGAKIANGKWLLFTDADTIHKPGSLSRAVVEAVEHDAALLSYSPEQEVRTFWEKAVMPVIFAELAATYPPAKVRDPNSPIAAANGQYVIVSRDAYDAVGGHAKIAADLLEDVAMARSVKSSGRKIWFRYGGDAVRTRMYRNWPQMKEGWTKNLALLFKHPGAHATMLLAFWAFSWTAFILALVGVLSGHPSAAGYALPLLFFYGRIAWGRFPATANLAALTLGVPISTYLLFRSARRHRRGGVTWKGRKYQAEVE